VEDSITRSSGFEVGAEGGVEIDLKATFSASVSYKYFQENSRTLTSFSSESIGVETSTFLTKEMSEEHQQQCSSDAGHLKATVYQMQLTRWDGLVTVKSRATWCVFDSPLPPLCPFFDACASVNCDRCNPGVFNNSIIDAAMSESTVTPIPEPGSDSLVVPLIAGGVAVAGMVLGASFYAYKTKTKSHSAHSSAFAVAVPQNNMVHQTKGPLRV
jgi:hypothetical protein